MRERKEEIEKRERERKILFSSLWLLNYIDDQASPANIKKMLIVVVVVFYILVTHVSNSLKTISPTRISAGNSLKLPFILILL